MLNHFSGTIALGILSVALSCGAGPVPRGLDAPFPSAAPVGAGPTLTYVVRARNAGENLEIEAVFPAGTVADLTVRGGVRKFVHDVEIVGTGEVIEPREGRFSISCPEGCAVRYEVALGEAADALSADALARRHGDLLLSPPSAWLLRPDPLPQRGRYRFSVETEPGIDFVTGVFRAEDSPETYEAPLEMLASAPFSAFGQLQQRRYEFEGGELELAQPPGALSLESEDVDVWMENAGTLVSRLYGKFPLPRIQIVLLPSGGDRLGFFRVLGYGGATVLASVGEGADKTDLDRDWRLLHELIHTGFPNVPRRSRWLEEGVATYAEPLLQARFGRYSPERVWKQFADRMVLGQPEPGDQGLDHTPTWGRIYWGGAAFCLSADVEIRRATDGKKSFDDALKAIHGAGGSIAVSWTLAEAMRIGDEAVGGTVPRDLHKKHGDSAEPFALDELFQELGVSLVGDTVSLDDDASDAEIRRSITQRR